MEYTLTFTEQQMQILNMALGEIPHKHAVLLIQSINDQIARKMAADTTAEDGKSQAALAPL